MTLRHPQSEIRHRDEWLLVGRVGKTHGVVGEVKIWPETDDPQRFEALETVYVGADREQAVPQTIESVRFQQLKGGTAVVLKLAGIDTLDDAAKLRGQRVFADADALPALDDDEYFLHDLIGLRVVSPEGEAFGTVKDVLEMPAHPVCVVARAGQPDAMLPAVPAFIQAIDFEAGTLVVEPIEGLFE